MAIHTFVVEGVMVAGSRKAFNTSHIQTMPQLPWDSEDERPTLNSLFSRVAVVWEGLHLKERWDQYRRIPTHLDQPPDYNYEPDENSSWRPLDTFIRTPERQRRKQSCCVCFGVNCTLIWKAIGIVVLISVFWNGFKFIRWVLKASPTGLESMPDYDSSLPCSSAPYIYQDGKITKSIPVGMSAPSNGFSFDITGSAVGTLELSPGAPGAEDVIVKLSLLASEKSVLSQVSFVASDTDNKLSLTTPDDPRGACMRYHIVVYVPSNLKHLKIDTKSVTQTRVDPAADKFPYLESISITSHSSSSLAMILPTSVMRASKLALQARGGWIVGSVSIGFDITEIDTTLGDAVTNLQVYAGPPPALLIMPVKLKTDSGSGRTDITYIVNEQLSNWHRQRPIFSNHTSHVKSDMYLTYKEAKFEGLVDIKSPSYSARNLQVMSKDAHENGKATHWHGNMEGKDSLKIVGAKGGWVGVYF